MSVKKKLVEKLEALLGLGLSFTVRLGWLVVLKKLVLAEVQIGSWGVVNAGGPVNRVGVR